MTSAKARLTLVNEISEDTLTGIEDFSHVWLIFLFHKDMGPEVDTPKEDHQSSSESDSEGKFNGLFANRDSQRINPIGLSLAKLDKVDGKTLYVSGVDVI